MGRTSELGDRVLFRLLQVSKSDSSQQLDHSDDSIRIGDKQTDRSYSCEDVSAEKVWVTTGVGFLTVASESYHSLLLIHGSLSTVL